VYFRQIEALKSLLAERDEIKSRELAFKRKCRRQLEELDVQIQQLEESNLLEESESHVSQVKALLCMSGSIHHVFRKNLQGSAKKRRR